VEKNDIPSVAFQILFSYSSSDALENPDSLAPLPPLCTTALLLV